MNFSFIFLYMLKYIYTNVLSKEVSMKTITLHNTNLSVPEIGMGCMRINSLETTDAVKEWIDTALAHDINFFDHADIYAKGQCEELFGKL